MSSATPLSDGTEFLDAKSYSIFWDYLTADFFRRSHRDKIVIHTKSIAYLHYNIHFHALQYFDTPSLPYETRTRARGKIKKVRPCYTRCII